MNSKADVADFISQPTLALVGVSRSGKKFSNAAMKELREKGYKVYPVNRNGGTAEGEPIYASLADLPEKVEAALVVVRPDDAAEAVRSAAAAGIQRVWLQGGSESPAALEAARELGVKVISGECILMFAGKNKLHGFHRFIWKLLGKLPN